MASDSGGKGWCGCGCLVVLLIGGAAAYASTGDIWQAFAITTGGAIVLWLLAVVFLALSVGIFIWIVSLFLRK